MWDSERSQGASIDYRLGNPSSLWWARLRLLGAGTCQLLLCTVRTVRAALTVLYVRYIVA
jgi:hypothetical protein